VRFQMFTKFPTALAGSMALALALAPGLPALAQQPPPPAAGRATNRVEQQITYLHKALKITPAQTPQWDAFTAVMRENAAHMDALYEARAKQFATMNAIAGLNSYKQIVQQHADDLQHLVPSFQALYDVMSPQQRMAADRLFRYRDAASSKKSATAPN